MLLQKLDGISFGKLVKSGALTLYANSDEIDALNVFPIPDGDTGLNMTKTMRGGVEIIDSISEPNISRFGKELSRAMLMAARGNSGVILSQIFRGIVKGFNNSETVDAFSLADAFLSGVKQAYRAVEQPTEGTILTVFREASEYAKENLKVDATINDYFNLHLEQARKTLANTINVLPVLKEAGVIDSGGAGYVYIVLGMVKYLSDEEDNIDFSLLGKEEHSLIHVEEKREHKNIAVVAVAQGKGIVDQFIDYDVDAIVNGAETMNPSTEDFIKAFVSLDADNIFVFPNNKNILMSARQAAELYKKANVVVINSVSIPQCMSALSMRDFSSDDVSLIINQFNDAIHNVSSIEIARAIRPSHLNGVKIEKDDWLVVLDGELVAGYKDLKEASVKSFEFIKNLDDKEVVTFIFGMNVDDKIKEEIVNEINLKYPQLEVGVLDGGQAVYDVLVGVE